MSFDDSKVRELCHIYNENAVNAYLRHGWCYRGHSPSALADGEPHPVHILVWCSDDPVQRPTIEELSRDYGDYNPTSGWR